MAIRIEQKGVAGLVGKAAVLAGQAQRARELEQIAIRRQEQIRAIEAQRETLQIQQQYQTNMKMLDAQLGLEQYERAKRWEIDKMEISSRLDFERDEKERARKIDEAAAGLTQLERMVDSGDIDKNSLFYRSKKFELEFKKKGLDAPTTPPSFMRPEKESILSLLGAPGEAEQRIVGGVPSPENPFGVVVEPLDITPLSAEVQQLEARNKLRVISPNGDEEIINTSDWPAKKAAGYILADIVELRERRAGERARPTREYYAGLGGRGV